jgi:hypothetical protein
VHLPFKEWSCPQAISTLESYKPLGIKFSQGAIFAELFDAKQILPADQANGAVAEQQNGTDQAASIIQHRIR